MNGGRIYDNKAISGGAVMLGGGSFTMNGGTIYGNESSGDSGAVDVFNGSFEMNGGTVHGNISGWGGADVRAYYGNVALYGGLIYGKGPIEKRLNSRNQVIYGEGMVISWDEQSGSRYYENGVTDIRFLSADGDETYAYWTSRDGDNGIACQSGSNTGFIAFPVSFDPITPADFSGYDLTPVTYDGSSRGIGTPVSAVFTDITVKYDGLAAEPKHAGTYEVSVEASARPGYPVTTIELGEYTIMKKPISIAVMTAADNIYDGTDAAEADQITFSGIIPGETLIYNTDYTVAGTFNSADADTADTVMFTVTLAGTGTAGNYLLSSTEYTAAATITPALLTGSVRIREMNNAGTAGVIEAGDTVGADLSDVLPAAATCTYQWYADGAAVSGATGGNWQIPAAAAGKTVTVTITGTGNYTGSVTSPAITVADAEDPGPEDPGPEDPDPIKPDPGSSDSDSSDQTEVTGFWKQETDGNWRYYTSAGTYAVNTWMKLSTGRKNGWYRFDHNGYMLTGWYCDANGGWYYLNPSTGRMTVGHQIIEDIAWYFNESSPEYSGWFRDDETGQWQYRAGDTTPLGALIEN